MDKYPDTYAVLVRRHGVYVWGDNVHKAKTMCERYVLFRLCVSGGRRDDGDEQKLITGGKQLGLPLPTRRRDEAARSSVDYRYRAYASYEEVSNAYEEGSKNNSDTRTNPKTLDQKHTSPIQMCPKSDSKLLVITTNTAHQYLQLVSYSEGIKQTVQPPQNH